MLDHIGLAVTDFERSKSFFIEALAPLDITILVEVTAEQTGGDAHAGFGAKGRPHFWIGNGQRPVGGLHVAFTAELRSQVEAFYQAGLAPEAATMADPGCGRITIRTTTPPSFSTPTATTSKRSAVKPSRRMPTT